MDLQAPTELRKLNRKVICALIAPRKAEKIRICRNLEVVVGTTGMCQVLMFCWPCVSV